MRKTGLIILSILYLAFTAGVSVQRHYCMNRMASLRFSAHPEERCGFCGMEKTERDNACCRDEQAVYKITDDQQAGQQEQLHIPLLSSLMTIHPLSVAPLIPGNINLTPVYGHGPPGSSVFPLFIRFGVFRI